MIQQVCGFAALTVIKCLRSANNIGKAGGVWDETI